MAISKIDTPISWNWPKKEEIKLLKWVDRKERYNSIAQIVVVIVLAVIYLGYFISKEIEKDNLSSNSYSNTNNIEYRDPEWTIKDMIKRDTKYVSFDECELVKLKFIKEVVCELDMSPTILAISVSVWDTLRINNEKIKVKVSIWLVRYMLIFEKDENWKWLNTEYEKEESIN